MISRIGRPMSKLDTNTDAARMQLASELYDIALEVRDEVIRAVEKHGKFASGHEGYAVLKEEVDELWDEIKANRGYQLSAMEEALQVAAMAIKYIHAFRKGKPE